MSIFFPLFFVAITNISWVLSSVVMMMPQNTNHKSFPESSVDEKPLPHPYNISWPIIGVSRYKFYERNSTCGWSSAWKYQCKHATVFAHQGGRETMEDRFVMDENINNTGISLYAVFDGYNGTFSVDYLAYNLMDTLKNKILDIKKNLGDENSKNYLHANGSINYRKLLHDEILAADKRLLKKLNEAKHIDPGCGCTALLAVIDHDQLYIANVGESRAVICNKEGIATRLTIDHNFESPQEIQRLVKEGADVYYAQGWSSTSRVLGDITHKGKDHVIPDPDVFIYDLSNSNSKFVVLASDGIWDCVAPSCRIKSVEEKVISCLNQNLDKNLFEAMINSTLYTYGQRFSDDNRTFMVVRTGRS